jgi:DNA-binding winged helix-turn-helix (wHTH) protein
MKHRAARGDESRRFLQRHGRQSRPTFGSVRPMARRDEFFYGPHRFFYWLSRAACPTVSGMTECRVCASAGRMSQPRKSSRNAGGGDASRGGSRRVAGREPGTVRRGSRLRLESVEVDIDRREARRGVRLLALTPRQFDLLVYLLRNAGRIVSRDEIARDVWQDATAVWTNVIAVAVHDLRKQLEQIGTPTLLHTVRGRGYVLDPDRLAPSSRPT